MRTRRRGFALHDLFGLLMVIGVVAMIGMAAVLRARDASRRALCVSNLKQIAQALHSYQATHGSYPLGVTASFNKFSAAMSAGVRTQGQPTDWSGWSAQALMLQYLDQTPLYNSINFDFEPHANAQEAAFNTTAAETRVSIFLCPNDLYAGRPSLNNYYASIGTTIQSMSHRPTGVFGYQSLCRSSDITDGEANTVAFAEGLSGSWQPRRYRGNGVVNVGTHFADPDTATAERYPDQLMENLQACHDAFNAPVAAANIFSGDRGRYWSWGAESMALFNTIVPPNSTQFVFNQCRYDCTGCFLQDADHSDITNASSYHPGGAHVLFCDGSVRFVKSSITMRTWWALGTRSSGEAVSADSF
jgi:prepilin-type processing-associated H-X9-DG protein